MKRSFKHQPGVFLGLREWNKVGGGGAGSEAFGEPEESTPGMETRSRRSDTITCVFLQENKTKKTEGLNISKELKELTFPQIAGNFHTSLSETKKSGRLTIGRLQKTRVAQPTNCLTGISSRWEIHIHSNTDRMITNPVHKQNSNRFPKKQK